MALARAVLIETHGLAHVVDTANICRACARINDVAVGGPVKQEGMGDVRSVKVITYNLTGVINVKAVSVAGPVIKGAVRSAVKQESVSAGTIRVISYNLAPVVDTPGPRCCGTGVFKLCIGRSVEQEAMDCGTRFPWISIDESDYLSGIRIAVADTEYSDETGYEITCPFGLPVAYDIDVLNYFMYRAQLSHSTELEFKTIRELLTALGYTDARANYERVVGSLKKWRSTRLSFSSRSFYVDQKRRITVRDLHVLDYKVSNVNTLLINIDEGFFAYNLEQYSRPFPLSLMERLTPYSKRIFELLRKNDTNLAGSQPYRIGFSKLALKVPIQATTTSKLLWVWKKSIQEINGLMPTYGMKYQYLIERDPQNSLNAMIRKLPANVRTLEDD